MTSPNHLGLKQQACEVCHQKEGLLRCSGCQAVYYCGRDHQASDRSSHKKACGATKKARIHLEQEEQQLRNAPPDAFTPDNVFETHVGHFWGIFETRPYMRARFELVDVLLRNFGAAGGRAHVVQTALDHLLDMLRLCRGDNMGLRDLIPALYMRLGRDQAAYDFVKWYATAGEDSSYDWGNMDLPFLDVKDADVLEPWSTDKKWINLNRSSTVALLKVRVLLDLQSAQSATRALHGTVPQEIIELVRGQLLSTIVQSRPEILIGSTEDIARLIETIKGQLKELYRSIHRQNPHFWRLMLDDPAAAIANRPSAYSPRSEEEACLLIGYNFAAWDETPRALDMLRTIREAV